MTSCLLYCKPIPSENGSILKGKNLLPAEFQILLHYDTVYLLRQENEYCSFDKISLQAKDLFVLRFYGPVNGVMSSTVSLPNHTFTGQA